MSQKWNTKILAFQNFERTTCAITFPNLGKQRFLFPHLGLGWVSCVFLRCYFTVTRLKELFQNWDKLDEDEKQYIDTQVEKWNSPAHVQLYKTVKRALNRWGKVQDTEGKKWIWFQNHLHKFTFRVISTN